LTVLIPTTTTLAASSQAIVSGQPLTLTATVSSANAGGVVKFYDGGANGTPLCTVAQVNGLAALTFASPRGGYHSFTAVYGGDDTYAPSVSVPVGVYVVGAPAAATLAAVAATNGSRLSGMAAPNGTNTTCWFRWGVLGDDYPNTTVAQNVGGGFGVLSVTNQIPAPLPAI
jgi:hypothetical protein